MIADAFDRQVLPLSPETEEKLRIYESLLRKWQKVINLVGPSTLENIIEKHFMESAQLIKYIHSNEIVIADMGSGAGFPGMVLAIMGVKNVHLIESDARKAVFLQNVSRETLTPVTVHNLRVEECVIPHIDIITARALAPLKDLLGLMAKLAPGDSARGLFLKGARAGDEIAEARRHWEFRAEVYNGLGKIVEISALSKKGEAHED